jgi:uncharacterized protein with GYD domain
MAKYLFQANYTQDGVKGLLKEGGTARRAAVEKAIKSLGGSVEAFYYAFGDSDLYIIADAPDHASVAALSLLVAASGVATVKTTVLLAPEEIDEAAKKHPAYRAPGE